MDTIKLQDCKQVENLQGHVDKDLATVRNAKKLLGCKCFTKEAEEKIEVLVRLSGCFEFVVTPEDFSQAVAERFDMADGSRISKMADGYIKKHYKKGPMHT